MGPPRGTGRAGKALWTAIAGTFDLEEHETEILRQAVVVADRISALDAAVVQDGVIISGRTHPALIESRLQRLALGRLLSILRLPDLEERRPQHRGGFRRSYQLRQIMGGGDGA
jgi:hypothetical protein